MNSLMTSKSSGNVRGHSVVPSSSTVIAVAGGVCVGGEGEVVFSCCCLVCRDHMVLSSMQMMFSASIGVDVIVTGTVGDGVVLVRIGDGGDGKFVISVDWAWGFGTCILKESLLVS